MWTHEFHRPPPEFINAENKFLFDEVDWEGFLRRKYRRFLTDTLPGITGLVFTFAETNFEIYKDAAVVSRHSPAERLRMLMEVLVRIGEEHGVRIAVRDFVYRLTEVKAMTEAIQGIPGEVAVMSKAVPHDWQPFYPPNPTIGQYGQREQWVEFDLGFEYEGQQMLPYANLEQIAVWYQAARAAGVRHFCLRLDRYDGEKGQSALRTPWGQLAISAFNAWERDPATSVETIYENWEKTHFPGAADAIRGATLSLQKMLFPKENWLGNHCMVPTYHYAKSHLVDGNADRLATWTGKAEDQEIRENFIHMPGAFRLSLEEEAKEALAIFGRVLPLVEKNLDPSHAAAGDWQKGFRLLGSYLRIFEAYRKAFFLIREKVENPSTAEDGNTIEQALGEFEITSQEEAAHWENQYFTGRPFHTTHYRSSYVAKHHHQLLPRDFLKPVLDDLRKVLEI